MHSIRMIAFAALTGLLTVPALAQHAHGGDVFLAVEDGRMITGELETPGELHPRRVFAAEFGALGENITDEPGYDSEPATFPAGSAIGFRIRCAVRAWNGTDFTTIAEERIAITRSTFPPPPPVFSPADDTVVEGFTVPVSPDGRWHVHLEYNLMSPAGPGVYLLELELFSTADGIAPSRPFWLVLGKLADEAQHDAAAEWASYVLAREGCPADFSRDRAVNSGDISAFLTRWLHAAAAAPTDPTADINGDAIINSGDISAFLTLWLNAVTNGC